MSSATPATPYRVSTGRSPASGSLGAAQLAAFAEHGYLVLPRFLPEELVAALRTEVDCWVDEGLRARAIACCLHTDAIEQPPVMELELGEHGRLISYPPLMAILEQLLGPVFVFHHLHSARHEPGCPDKPWHHDYEQRPQRSRSRLMVHVLHYLNGLNGTIGDLVILPGSQTTVAEKSAMQHLGTVPLPGEVVIDDLPVGSTVIVHSAVFHARRAKPGGETQEARYFIDCSYCQGGARWPAAKPYWRQVLARARALDLDRGDWPELFSERHFDEYVRPETPEP